MTSTTEGQTTEAEDEMSYGWEQTAHNDELYNKFIILSTDLTASFVRLTFKTKTYSVKMSNKTKKRRKYSELKGGSGDFFAFLLEKMSHMIKD